MLVLQLVTHTFRVGHGPFSHLFESMILKKIKNWVAKFDYMPIA